MSDEAIPMTSDVLRQLREMAVQAALPTVLKIPGGPEHVTLLTSRDEQGGVTSEHVTADPLPRGHWFEDVGSFIDFCKRLLSGEHGPAKPCIWCGPGALVVIVDDQVRRDRAILLLPTSTPFNCLASSLAAAPRTQSDFIRLLRINLASTLTVDSRLLGLVRNIKFAHNDTGAAEVQHGRESMGREITQSVLGLDVMPEEVDLFVPVFDVPDAQARQKIRCALDVVVSDRTFRLVPLPLECSNARAAALGQIIDRLKDTLGEQVPIYFGAP
jgi:hypothetical protein